MIYKVSTVLLRHILPFLSVFRGHECQGSTCRVLPVHMAYVVRMPVDEVVRGGTQSLASMRLIWLATIANPCRVVC